MLLASNTCATVDGACVAFAVGLDIRNVTDIVRRSASRFNPSRCAQYTAGPAVPVASLVGMPRPARCGIHTGSSAVAPVRPCSTVGQVKSRVDLHCSGFACRAGASAVPARQRWLCAELALRPRRHAGQRVRHGCLQRLGVPGGTVVPSSTIHSYRVPHRATYLPTQPSTAEDHPLQRQAPLRSTAAGSQYTTVYSVERSRAQPYSRILIRCPSTTAVLTESALLFCLGAQAGEDEADASWIANVRAPMLLPRSSAALVRFRPTAASCCQQCRASPYAEQSGYARGDCLGYTAVLSRSTCAARSRVRSRRRWRASRRSRSSHCGSACAG